MKDQGCSVGMSYGILSLPVTERLTENRLKDHTATTWRAIVLSVILLFLDHGCVDERLSLWCHVHVETNLSQSHSPGDSTLLPVGPHVFAVFAAVLALRGPICLQEFVFSLHGVVAPVLVMGSRGQDRDRLAGRPVTLSCFGFFPEPINLLVKQRNCRLYVV